MSETEGLATPAPKKRSKPKSALVSLKRPSFMKVLRAVDKACIAQRWPALSKWWLDVFARFVDAERRQLVLRVGRRGGKSTSLCRFAVAFALAYDMAQIPPGDVGIVGIVSVSRDEANQRLRTIKALLDLLEVKYKPVEGGIELVDRAIVFKTFAATLGGVVGGTWILAICDEVSRWRDSDTGANPATEVLASLRPTMATQPLARIFLSSSPLGMLDAHFDAFEAGDTDFQLVAGAPTWDTNPTLTKEATRALEPDELVWLREYGAVPQADADSSLLIELIVDRATRSGPLVLPPESGCVYRAAIDPAMRGNAWTLALATRTADGKRRIVMCREWKGTRANPLNPSKVFEEIKALLAPYGIRSLYSDQHAGDALNEIARQHAMFLELEPWTATSKAEAFEGLRTQLLDGELELPPDPQVKVDLLGIRKILTRNGVSYILATQGARHSDYAPAIAMVAKHVKTVQKVAKPKPTVEEHNRSEKKRFLVERERAQQKAQRLEDKIGRIPITHRHLYGPSSVRRPALRWEPKQERSKRGAP